MQIAILEDDDRRQELMTRILHELGCPSPAHFFDNAPDMVAWLGEHLQQAQLVGEVGQGHPETTDLVHNLGAFVWRCR